MNDTAENKLGRYLRDRRARLDPAALGFAVGRRRTPGLRREEVAQRAHISATWYTWLEQGRGGAPSAAVLDRLADGLVLDETEREHLFLLALGHPPKACYTPVEQVSPRLQRLIDTFEIAPAIVKTATWDVLAWNRAAAHVLTDYSTLPRADRNILRLIFTDSEVKARQSQWWQVARFVVGAARADTARTGASEPMQALVEDLSATSEEFRLLWHENDVADERDGTKRLDHPVIGWLEFEFSAFIVEGQPELGLIVYLPSDPDTAERLRHYFAHVQ